MYSRTSEKKGLTDTLAVKDRFRNEQNNGNGSQRLDSECERYKAFFEYTPDSCFITTMQGVIQEVNQAAIQKFGIPGDYRRIGFPLSMFVDRAERLLFMDQLRRIEKKQSLLLPWRTWLHSTREDTFYADLTVWVVQPDGAEQQGSLCWIIRDITRVKQREERQYRAVLEASPYPMHMMDTDLTIRFCNQPAAKLFGYASGDELVGQSLCTLFVPERHQRIHEQIQRALMTKHVEKTEYCLRKKDGTDFPCEIHLSLLMDDAGEPQFVVGTINDISSRKHDAARLQMAQFSFDYAADGVAWYTPEGRYLYVNYVVCHTTGFSRMELLDTSIFDLDANLTLEQWQERWQYMKHHGSDTYETVHHRKDGTSFPVEVTMKYLEFQGCEYLCSFIRDITERNRVKQKLTTAYEELKAMNRYLEHSRDVLHAVLDSLQDGVLLLDNNGYVLAANKSLAALLDCTSHDLVGQHWATCYPRIADDFPGHIALGPHMHTSGYCHRTRYRRSNGVTRVLDIQKIVLHGFDQSIDKHILHVADVTERIQLEVRGIENERFAANGRLAASIAHEINTPLQAIQTSLGLAQRHSSPQERERFFTMATEEVQRVAQVVRNLLDLYRPAASAEGPVNVNALIERVLLLTKRRFKEQHVDVTHDLQPDVPEIWGRADQLQQIVLNLAINALEAMQEGGRLHIRTSVSHHMPDAVNGQQHMHGLGRRASQSQEYDVRLPAKNWRYLLIEVADTGDGISLELQKHIFEPFMTTKKQGTGLGLAISTQIVKEHGGYITVQSELGQGSTFTVVLPITGTRRMRVPAWVLLSGE